jgi:indolepyruvate ferredoxin oxidoreductase beta subunit
MSQRGGSVCSDVRFGQTVLSPMVTPGEADFLVVLAADQVEVNRSQLRAGGILITPDAVDAARLLNRKSLNIALLGVLSRHVEIPAETWLAAMRACFPEKLHSANQQAFEAGREIPSKPSVESP